MRRLTKKLKLQIADRLDEVADNIRLVPERGLGICDLVYEEFGVWSEQLYKYFKTWPDYSGITVFPVPMRGETPNHAFRSRRDEWTGRYGQKRRDLCRHIAREMRKEATCDTK